MSYQLRVLKDHPIGFWPLDESSGSIAYDASSCLNNSSYTGGVSTGRMPLVSGGTCATKIDSTHYITYSVSNDYTGSTGTGSFGTSYSSDNDFSLECWYYPLDLDDTYQTILGDTAYCAILANSTNIKFKLESESIEYTIPFHTMSMHVVATYHPDRISLYLNGELVISKALTDYKFSNSTKTLLSKASGSKSFLLDAPAIYRYELNKESIKNHYRYNNSIEPIHVVTPDGGSLIEFYDTNLSTKFKQIYPSNKGWEHFLNEDLVYDTEKGSLSLKYNSEGGSKDIDIVDLITIPNEILEIASNSKIEWESSKGVVVKVSDDGSTWSDCSNGLPLPTVQNNFYLKIILSSSDISKYLTSITNLSIKFISSDDTVYSKNVGAYSNNFVNSCVLDRYPVLNRSIYNGINCGTNGTFDIYENFAVGAIEFIYTPKALTKTRLQALFPGTLYINGQLSSGTNMSDLFKVNEMHHVVINVSSLSDLTNFNKGGDPAVFQNVALYPSSLTSNKILNHYNLYIGKPSISVQESSWSMTETGFKTYNNNWTLIQNS